MKIDVDPSLPDGTARLVSPDWKSTRIINIGEPTLLGAKAMGEIKARPIPFQAWIVVAWSTKGKGYWKIMPGFWDCPEAAMSRARALSGHWIKRYVFALDNGESEGQPVATLRKSDSDKERP